MTARVQLGWHPEPSLSYPRGMWRADGAGEAAGGETVEQALANLAATLTDRVTDLTAASHVQAQRIADRIAERDEARLWLAALREDPTLITGPAPWEPQEEGTG